MILFFIGFLLTYFGIKMFINSTKRLNKLNYLATFEVTLPENFEDDNIPNKIQKLIDMDWNREYISNDLEYFLIRLRLLEFPYGTIVTFNGKSGIV